MAYKMSRGKRGFGDIEFEDDADTGIDFGQDQISLETSGSVRMQISNNGVLIPDLDPSATGSSLFVSGGIQITPGNQEGIRFANKGNNELNFISFQEGSEGGSYNARLGYNAAEYIFIAPGRAGDFFVNSGKASGNFTYPFSIMDDGTAKFTKGLEDSNVRAADLTASTAFYVSGTLDGNNNAVFLGRVGIGTDTPDSTLHIAGNVHISGSDQEGLRIAKGDNDYRQLVFENDGVDAASFTLSNSENLVIMNETAGKDIQFWVDSAAGGDIHAITIKESGKVGIGIDAPDHALHVAGDIGVDQYIYHNGDPDTFINLLDDKIVMKAGNIAMVTMEQKANAPHEVTINDGSNNIDFVVKGNGSGAGNPGMKFDADTNRLGINGVGSPDKALHVGGSMKLDGTEPSIFFADGGTDKAEIGINNSDNIVIENKTINKHIVFKVNDQGTVKEGLRLDGAVPEVVVNQTSDSLVDFRVESDNQTHMLFVDGNQDRIGIGVSNPDTTLDISGTIKSNGGIYRRVEDVSSNKALSQNDYCVRCIQNNAITLTLPSKTNNAGQILIIKDALGNAGSPNNRPITIAASGSETIDGQANTVINMNHGFTTLICDGINGWMIIG